MEIDMVTDTDDTARLVISTLPVINLLFLYRYENIESCQSVIY